MTQPSIELTESPSEQDLEILTAGINKEAEERGSAHPFALFLRDEKHQIIAGCNGSVFFGVIYTDQLWVHPEHRKKGLGKRLMEQVHAYGTSKGCTLTTVANMDFQAPSFYQHLGYKVDFSRAGHHHGATCLFLSKPL